MSRPVEFSPDTPTPTDKPAWPRSPSCRLSAPCVCAHILTPASAPGGRRWSPTETLTAGAHQGGVQTLGRVEFRRGSAFTIKMGVWAAPLGRKRKGTRKERKKKKKKKTGQDSAPGTERLEPPGQLNRLHSQKQSSGSSPSAPTGTAAQGEEEPSAVTRALSFRHRPPALASPHPHSLRLMKVCRLRSGPPNGTSGERVPLTSA